MLVPDDEITITITYRGADGTDCSFGVPVVIEITTRDSGIHETGGARLTGQAGSTQFAFLTFSGDQVDVSGELTRSNGTVAISGSLQALVASLPGSSAQFPAPVTSTGSGGSGGAP
jgi:hypothetical protein